MRTFRAVLAFMLVLGTVAAGSAAAPTANERATYIVVLDDSVSNVAAEARQMVNAHRGELGFVYEHALKGFSAKLTAQAASAIARSPRVVAVNADRPVHMTETIPTGVSRIDSPTAHDAGATGAGVRVAIIDTGIDLEHPDLAANIDTASGIDCFDSTGDADDDQGHGTHVAGTVAANGGPQGNGVVGVARGATLIPVKVLNSSGSGSWTTVICGIDHVAGLSGASAVHVANLSLGGSGSANGQTCETTTESLYVAICNAIDAGITIVVAAGNDSANASNFVPAAYPEVITVSAYSDRDGTSADIGCTGRGPFRTCDETFASFSNYGAVVDVIAPGVNINSTTMGGSYGTKSGTSMAAPHAAGVAALVLQKNPGLKPDQVEAHLRNTGQCPDGKENPGEEECTGQAWRSDKDNVAEPMVNAAFATKSTSGGGGGETEPVEPDPGNTDPVASTLTGSSMNDGSTWTATVTYTGPSGTAGTWTGGASGSCNVGPDGSCKFSLAGIPKKVSSVTYTDTSTGMSVTINKP